MDAEELFVRYTVDEIRKIEKSTRADIEKKKEDLRQMVGERYRDLIEAADTISEMKNCSVMISQSVQDLQKHCVNLQKTMMTRGVAGVSQENHQGMESKKKFYSISSEIKLLVGIPDRIWSALEGSSHLEATQLYQLACHVTKSLQLDSSTPQSAQILKWFPVLTRQWATLSHFKHNILQSSRDLLRDSSVSDKKTAEALCSILLLEDSSPRQVFAEFLLARKAAIQSCLTLDLSTASIKQQVHSVASVAERTLRQIHSIFYSHEDSGDSSSLLFDILSAVCDTTSQQVSGGSYHIKLELGNFGRYLPGHIRDFRPSLATPAAAIATSYLQQSVNQWVETCSGDVQRGVGKFLDHITTIRALTSIRDDVYELLMETEGDRASWKSVCEKVLKRRFSIWSEFLRSLFVTRIQGIIQDSLDKTTTETQSLVSEAMSGIQHSPEERSICDYVWQESGLDLPSEAAWDRGSISKNPLESGGLFMKTKAFTPKSQSICASLDERVATLLEDLSHYTNEVPSSGQERAADVLRSPPFDRYADNTTLFGFMQITSVLSATKLCDFIKAQLLSCKAQLESGTTDGENQRPVTIDRALLLGRLCGSIVDLCVSLKRAVSIADAKESKADPTRSRSRFKQRSSTSEVLPEEKEWYSMTEMFNNQRAEAYRIWSGTTSSLLLAEFAAKLEDVTPSSALKMITKWDKIEIQEETDDGKKVTSTILLPVQSSWYVQCLLYGLCEEISRVGGHALPRSTVSTLIETVSTGLVSSYADHLKTMKHSAQTLNQSQALQWLFDVRFLSTIMSGRGETKKVNAAYQKQVKAIVDALEGFIDPFDLDVFHPHLQQKLNSHCQRCSLLKGALTNPNKHMYSTHRAASATYQEQHNVLPVASSQLRFNLLPLSTIQGPAIPAVQPAIPQVKPQPHKPKMRSPSTPNLFGTSGGFHKSQTVPASLTSKFESLKTGWLSNLGVQPK